MRSTGLARAQSTNFLGSTNGRTAGRREATLRSLTGSVANAARNSGKLPFPSDRHAKMLAGILAQNQLSTFLRSL
jgi:hypothetical protein